MSAPRTVTAGRSSALHIRSRNGQATLNKAQARALGEAYRAAKEQGEIPRAGVGAHNYAVQIRRYNPSTNTVSWGNKLEVASLPEGDDELFRLLSPHVLALIDREAGTFYLTPSSNLYSSREGIGADGPFRLPEAPATQR